MFSIKNNILYFIVLSALIQVQSLVERLVEDNEIFITESAIRNTVNGIFSVLHLEGVKQNPRFGEFATIHNLFVTITLQDHENLKEVKRKARVDNIDNKTQYFITQLNEVLNEDNKSHEVTDDAVNAHIETFLRKLEYLKLKHDFTNNVGNFSINRDVLSILDSGDSLKNATEETEEDETDDNLFSSNEYWQPSARRIYKGRRKKIKQFPFMASVQFFKKFQCGGSIIKSDLVITSASCLQLAWNNRFFRENPAFLSVQVGHEFYEGGGENIPVMEVYFHPEYNPKNLKNNLAIMRLLRVLKFGRRVKKIKKIMLDREPSPLPVTTPGITIVGWGARSSTNVISNIWTNRLSSAVLDFYPLRECQEVYSSEFVTNKNFCAGFFSKGGGACNRDAGGPGVSNGVLVGVVSFGAPNCGAPDAPTVFTKVGYYTEWIESILDLEPPTSKKRTTKTSTRETYDINNTTQHYLSTKPEIKLWPVTTVTKQEITDGTPLPIRSLDVPRNLDVKNLFKEFITTMFGNEAVKEYLDQFTSKTESKVTHNPTTKENIRFASVKSTTESITESDIEDPIPSESDTLEDQVGSVKMVTIIDNFDERLDETTMPSEIVENTSVASKKVKKKAQQNIAKLFKDTDIQDLFLSMSSEIFSDSGIMIDVSEESFSDDYTNDNDDDDDNFGSQSKVKTNKKVKKEKINNGLSIPAELYNDVTFKQNNSGTILDIFSTNDILNLLNEAIADVAKSKQHEGSFTQGIYFDRRLGHA